MNDTQPFYPYSELMQKLQNFCDDKLTGTLFITTHDNHSIRFCLKQGKIVVLAYRFKYGNNALPFIRDITSGRFAFKKNVLSGKDDTSLPTTDTLLKELCSEANSSVLIDKKTVSAADSNNVLSVETEINNIKTELCTFIGPIANFICNDYIKDYGHPSNLSELKKMRAVLSKDIGNKEQEKLFKKE